MLRTALACCALISCKGSPSEDKRAPAQAPVALDEPADAAPPDAPSAPCYAMPFDAEAERAGIQRLAHRIPPATRAPSKLRDMVKLPVGKPTVVPGLRPWKAPPLGMTQPPPPRPPLGVAEVAGADALVAMATWPDNKVTLTAPAHLEGAVVTIRGDTTKTLAIGDTGVATLARYREHYVKPRLAQTPLEGGKKVALEPLAVLLVDIDGDGTIEQVSFSSVLVETERGSFLRREVELGILWAIGELAFARICCRGTEAAIHYIVPPTLSGGKPMLVSDSGDRVVLDGKTLTKLPQPPTQPPPPIKLPSDPSIELEREPTNPKRCLQTSATEPATIVAAP